MHQFQWTKCLSTHAKHNSTASTKKRKSHLEPSVTLRAQIENDSTPAHASQRFSATEPPFTRKNTMFRANPNNAFCQGRLANHNQNRKTVLENKYPSRSLGAAIPLRSDQTELRNTIELQHYCWTHRSDTPVPMHKVSQHTQKHNGTASTKKRKSHLEPSATLRAQMENDSTLKRRCLQPSRTRANFSLQRNLHYRKNCNVLCKS